MSIGIILNAGKNHIRDTLLKAKTQQNLFLGLMAETTLPGAGSDLGLGITEITGTGYARIEIVNNTDWTLNGDGVVDMSTKQFVVGAGGWNGVGGYFIASALTGGVALYSDIFPVADQGTQTEDTKINVNIKHSIKDVND